MKISKDDITSLDKIKRLNLINSITGIKPANLIGTISENKISNLAIFSSVVHLGSAPALIGMITRPTNEVPRHTYDNIVNNQYYTINHVPNNMMQEAHQTSAKYLQHISEFDSCGFTEEYIDDFIAPYVKESIIKIGMKYIESIPIKINGTILCIGEIQNIIIPEECISNEGYINLEQSRATGISGLNSYYKVTFENSYAYARANSEKPN